MHLFFSPHPDDAVLSCGGRLIKENKPMAVVNVFAGEYSGRTEWDKLCGLKDNPQKRRLEEDKRILNSIQVKQINLDFKDIAVYKDIFETPRNDEEIKREIKKELKKILKSLKPDVAFFPLGVEHEDHKLLHQIGREIEDNVLFYEDLPYLLGEKVSFSEFKKHKYEVTKETVEEKVGKILEYETQINGLIKLSEVESKEKLEKKLKEFHFSSKRYMEIYRSLMK